jgi:hypothetical protein
MPLPAAAARTKLHQRNITLDGYLREDGLMDIEAHMTDVKTYTWENKDRGVMHPGDPLHDMWLRVTMDRELTIVAVEVAMDGTPHNICPGVVPNYQRLVGLKIAKGFIKEAMAGLAGVQGCTHLRELLQPIGTVAFQTMLSAASHAQARPQGWQRIPRRLLNTCYAYDETGPLNTPAPVE